MNAQLYAEIFAADRKPMPPQMIQGLVQAADVLTIILAAVVSYLTVPTPAGLQAHAYVVAISIVLAARTFRLTGSERRSDASGKSVSVRVTAGGRRSVKNKTSN